MMLCSSIQLYTVSYCKLVLLHSIASIILFQSVSVNTYIRVWHFYSTAYFLHGFRWNLVHTLVLQGEKIARQTAKPIQDLSCVIWWLISHIQCQQLVQQYHCYVTDYWHEASQGCSKPQNSKVVTTRQRTRQWALDRGANWTAFNMFSHFVTLWPFDLKTIYTCMISQGHSLYQVWRLSDHLFLSYAANKQTDRHTQTQTHTDADEHFTPATVVGVSDNRNNTSIKQPHMWSRNKINSVLATIYFISAPSVRTCRAEIK